MVVVAAVTIIGLLARNKDNPKRREVTADTASVSASATGVVASAVVSATASPSATAPAEGKIHVRLSAAAPNAEFTIDDGPKMKSPVTLTVTRDRKPHKLAVTAPGFRSETKTVSFDEDVAWAVVLVGSHTKEGTKPPTTPSSSATTTTAPSETAPAPTASGRKKRELDPDNPYAQ